MNAKHTPGPWRVKANGNVWVGLDSTDASDPEYGAADSTRGIERHAIATFHGTRATSNATLVAAAPDLLAACEELQRCAQGVIGSANTMSVSTDAVMLARAAIAKARQS